MFGIIIFFVVITLILWFLRYFGLKYYERIEKLTLANQVDKAHDKPMIKSKNKKDDELIPVIIAAASAILCSKVKVKKISFVDPTKGNEWTHTGRIQNLSSHYMTVPKTYKY